MQALIKSYHWVIQPLLVIVILVFGFVGAMGFSMFKEEPRATERISYSPLVQVVNTEASAQQIRVTGNGTLQARTRINIVPQVGGRVTYIHPDLRAGGAFKADEVLIAIEAIDYQLALTQREADVAAAQTTLELEMAEAEAAREEWRALNPGKPLPTLVGRQPQIKEAEAEVKAAKARLAQARLDLQRTELRMPFDGRVVATTIDVGEVVAANQSVGVVYSSERFEIPIPLEIDQLAWIDLPDQASGREGSSARVQVRIGDREHSIPARVIRVESELESLSRFARVVLGLDAGDIPAALRQKVIPGLFVEVSIASRELREVTALPRATLRQGGLLWIVEDGVLRYLQPDIVYRSAKEIFVRDIEPGTRVVMSGLDVVTEGMRVQIAGDS
jgi:RND family efflux transporter MFP subunit